MWECVQVGELWIDIQSFLNTIDTFPILTIKQVLFEFPDDEMDSIKNFVVLAPKGYIWKSKVELSTLSLTAWKNYFKVKLEDLKVS